MCLRGAKRFHIHIYSETLFTTVKLINLCISSHYSCSASPSSLQPQRGHHARLPVHHHLLCLLKTQRAPEIYSLENFDIQYSINNNHHAVPL